MRVPVEMRVYRILRKWPPFVSLKSWEDYRHGHLLACPLATGESLLGVYENETETPDDLIVFTDQGIYIKLKTGWEHFRYAEMQSTLWPDEGKNNPQTLPIQLLNGSKARLPVHKGNLFGLMTFFMRVIGDQKKEGEFLRMKS